jgi:hypothetical protein
VTDDRKLHNASIIIYNLKEILLGWSNQKRDGQFTYHTWLKWEIYTFWLGSQKGGVLLQDLRIDERILKLIFKKYVTMCHVDSTRSRQKPVAGSCEHGNIPLGSIKAENFLCSDYYLLKNSIPWSQWVS